MLSVLVTGQPRVARFHESRARGAGLRRPNPETRIVREQVCARREPGRALRGLGGIPGAGSGGDARSERRGALAAGCRADATDGNEMHAPAIEQERREQMIRVASSSDAVVSVTLPLRVRRDRASWPQRGTAERRGRDRCSDRCSICGLLANAGVRAWPTARLMNPEHRAPSAQTQLREPAGSTKRAGGVGLHR